MLNAPINVVFFRCLCHCLFKNPGVETLRFYGFSPVCVASLCVGTSMGFYDFFPVGGPLCVWGLWDFTVFFAVCGAPVSGDFEILRFFTCVCGRCVWGLWDFTALRFYGTLRFCVFPLCVGPVLETLKILKKISCTWQHFRTGLFLHIKNAKSHNTQGPHT